MRYDRQQLFAGQHGGLQIVAQARILYCNGGVTGEELYQCHVHVTERGSIGPPRQIQVADDIVLQPHGNAEERTHLGVVGRYASGGRVIAPVREAQHFVFLCHACE
jgi:hypothetical protein